MSRARRTARLAALLLLAGGVTALAYAAYVVVDATSFQSVEQQRFNRARRQAAGMRETMSLVHAPVDGGTLAVIVVQGDSERILRRAVGHLAATALPGETGNVVLAGHRDTFFRSLRNIRRGDVITFKTHEGDFDYVVEATSVVRPSDVKVLRPTGGRTLTLITCFPFYYLGPAPDRFVVRARETIRRQVAPANDPY
jgi:sortase A